ncbi:MAG: alpha/beta fold hydrolase [Clostridia bacterium]|nr:alpha/beta fold hydrolase [Clostridia bacterium]
MSENNAVRRASGQYIEIGNKKIRYFEEGVGDTVIMIHGIGQAMYTFRKSVHVLSEYCHVITIDLIGHGLSDKPECDYTIDDFSQLVNDFMYAMDIPSATLMGFSTGAIIALDVALKHPEKVERLILLSPGGITKTYPSLIKHLTTPIISDLIFTFFSSSMVKKVLEEAYYDPGFVTTDVVRHYYKVLSNKENLDAAMIALSNWNDEDIAYQLADVKAPAYIFWGENDTWHPMDMLELYEEALPDVYSATFAECGHLLHEERADELNKKLIEIFTINRD